MRIGIIGLTWDLGVPLALALRDYGGHAVIGYGTWDSVTAALLAGDPQPEREVRQMLEAWPLPVTDRMDIFAQYPDLVFVCEDRDLSMVFALLGETRRPDPAPVLPVVLACPLVDPFGHITELARRHPVLDIGYSPMWTTRADAIETITSPRAPIHVAGSGKIWQTAEQAWRRVVNTVPVRRVPLGAARMLNTRYEDIAEPPPVASDGLGGSSGHVDTPAVPEAEEKP